MNFRRAKPGRAGGSRALAEGEQDLHTRHGDTEGRRRLEAGAWGSGGRGEW